MLSDALGIRRDLGPQDDIAAVRQREREGDGARRKEKMSQKGKTFMILSRLCAFEDFGLRLMFFAYIIFMAIKTSRKIKPLSECKVELPVVDCNKNFAQAEKWFLTEIQHKFKICQL